MCDKFYLALFYETGGIIRILIVALPEEDSEDVCLSNVTACCQNLNYDNCDVKLQMFVYTT